MRPFGLTLGLIAVAIATLALFIAFENRRTSTVVSFPDGVNVLNNGSFEDDGKHFQPDPTQGGVMSLTNGSNAIPGWTVVASPNQEISWIKNGNALGNPGSVDTTDGSFFLDLTGIHDVIDPKTGDSGGVKQAFPTVIGRPYWVTFQIGIFNPRFHGPINAVATIQSGDQNVPIPCGPFNPPDPANQWMTAPPCQGGFTAKDTTATLTILGIPTNDHNTFTTYIGLDAVSVECVAPLGIHANCR
jgi:hypothetical protein